MNTIELKIAGIFVNIGIPMQRRVTILKGDSGTGKTTIVNEIDNNPRGVSADGLNVITLNSNSAELLIKESTDCVFVIDDVDFILESNFIELINTCAVNNNQFYLIIIRTELCDVYPTEKFSRLPVSLNSVLILKDDGNKHYHCEQYFTPKEFSKNVDTIYCEDSKAGFEFYQQLFKANVVSTFGKDKMVDFFSKAERSSYVIDNANIGSLIDRIRIFEYYFGDIRILTDYECFEELILHSNMFYGNSDIEEDPNNYLNWEEFFECKLKELTEHKPYKCLHGSSLSQCYKIDCDKCNPNLSTKCSKYIEGSKLEGLLIGTKNERLLEHKLSALDRMVNDASKENKI